MEREQGVLSVRAAGIQDAAEKESKLALAASMAAGTMPTLSGKHNVILLCDRWYAKKDLLRLAYDYDALDIICNAHK